MNKLNLEPTIKRVSAYMIDILLVTIIASLITSIPLLNKNYHKYQEKYNEYQEKYKQYIDINKELKESYQDELINEEEYNNLLKNNLYQEKLTSIYEDNTITKEEYNDLLNDIDKEYNQTVKDNNYKLKKLGISNSVITILTTLLYFGIIQYLFKGQTLGKRILNLKVVSSNNKKLTIINYLLRTLIINNILLNGINVLFLSLTTRNIFEKCDNIVSFLITFIETLTIYYVISRKDNRGVHDLICHTKVISTKE